MSPPPSASLGQAPDSSSAAITILSNILGANIDVGLKYCLELGYHDDPALRTGFMRLMNTILQNGTRFGGLGAKRTMTGSQPFSELVSGPNLALSIAVCEACPSSEADELLPVIFKIFESNGSILNLMKGLIEREVAQTSKSSLWHPFVIMLMTQTTNQSCSVRTRPLPRCSPSSGRTTDSE
jgi:neurofibromin 1